MDNGDLLSIAEVSGIFVAFGALISVSRDSLPAIKVPLRGLVAAGLGVLVASLTPVGLGYYGISGESLWRVSCVAFLILIWLVIAITAESDVEDNDA